MLCGTLLQIKSFLGGGIRVKSKKAAFRVTRVKYGKSSSLKVENIRIQDQRASIDEIFVDTMVRDVIWNHTSALRFDFRRFLLHSSIHKFAARCIILNLNSTHHLRLPANAYLLSISIVPRILCCSRKKGLPTRSNTSNFRSNLFNWVFCKEGSHLYSMNISQDPRLSLGRNGPKMGERYARFPRPMMTGMVT